MIATFIGVPSAAHLETWVENVTNPTAILKEEKALDDKQ